MQTHSKKQLWAGRVLSGLAVAFLLMDGITKLIQLTPVVAATTQLGYDASAVVPIGVLVLVGTVLYCLPRTSVLGAIYLTGFLGGAIATHVRLSNPLFSHTLFPLYLAAFMWGGLLLRDTRLWSLLLPREA
ncbi:DoxX family protein [Corallococcus sp. H22C18031201]|uniref:DoxX family protein n=1 Tax=Citreicoccus inhibens TaxID=2849499 RepID=UPI000E762068|nr:DoxX family protein [Citreicoccus inhibens]MBU8894043.1 DoxX family protein [Citreicoccus inhibens]RJS23234.1 DoxX family protein [Corallococcus sp. H22C18031201]